MTNLTKIVDALCHLFMRKQRVFLFKDKNGPEQICTLDLGL